MMFYPEDPELDRIHWSDVGMDAYAEAESRFCSCEVLCTCGWNRPGSAAMRWIERMEQGRRRAQRDE